MNGQALDLFGPGRYTLETENIPKIGKVLNRTTGDKTPFHCEVYFINKAEQMAIKWGTDSKVQYVDPTYGFPISIGASGEMSLRAEDSRKLLVKLVGTENYLGQQQLIGFFRAFLMTRVKTYIAQVVKANAINIFEIDENLTAFSENIHKLLIPDFADYGIALERFFVTNIVKPDGDRQYEKFKELHFRQYADIARRRSARRRISSMRRQRRRRWSSILRLRPQSEPRRAIHMHRSAASMWRQRWRRTRRSVSSPIWVSDSAPWRVSAAR